MITIAWGTTNIIYVPKSFMEEISSTLYNLDTNEFRLALKELEASFYGMAYPKTHVHNTAVTVAGTTFARTIEILPPYSVEFEDGQYTVVLQGSNNNIFDVANGILVRNQVQVLSTNSSGLIVTSGSGGGSYPTTTQIAERVRTELEPDLTVINNGVKNASLLIPHTTNI